MAKLLRLTAEEFDEQKHKLRTLAASTTDLARLILVDGMTNTDAARAAKVSRQNVKKAMDRVMALLSDLPSDYVWFEGFMSPQRALSLKEEIRKDLNAYAVKKAKKK
ncbi:TrfB-related DNA-binding protein [Pseudomonas protegens]|uniref:TrfB-related DNA-binding protein n=1 Tax=Pseudomonas protegens TaxID=380021 RepID=UPI0023ECEB1A|nr:TrfB-related DNA-binding protein [Pseudomonas protegens]MDF4211158.1 TrfB-related DNA-binding protein [Pseudomonas protegens]